MRKKAKPNPLSKRDQRHIKHMCEKAKAYIPYGVEPYKNLDLIEEVIAAVNGLKDTEITSCKEHKRIFRYAFIVGCYTIMQKHNEVESGKKNIREYLKKDYLSTLPKDNEKPTPDYSKGI